MCAAVTDLCNCASGCSNPFNTSMCPTTGSSGPLRCRLGSVGSKYELWGGVTELRSVSPNSYGNLRSYTFPAGSICMSSTKNSAYFLNYTTYEKSTVNECRSNLALTNKVASVNYNYNLTNVNACTTDNCGAPAPTWLECPATQAATSCYLGVTGPAGAAAVIGQMLGYSILTPAATTVVAGACLSGVATCDALVAKSVVTAAQCPAGQSVTVYLAGGDDATSYSQYTCSDRASLLTSDLQGTMSVACGTNNCNAPTTLATSTSPAPVPAASASSAVRKSLAICATLLAAVTINWAA